MTQDIFTELGEQIIKAEEMAFLKGIKTNTVILNKDFDFVKEFAIALQNKSIIDFKPMICGKHIIVGTLPTNYSFALTEIDETKFETELEYYKRRCEELEQKLENIRGELELL